MQTERSIAIVGGGPGGLTLARLLATRGISATVFELDEHPLARPQGGSLDLHGESGLRALGEAGLMERFAELARYEDQGDAIYDPQGVLRFAHIEAAGGDRPEIDRTQLRAMLLDSLPAERVRWSSKISAVEPAGGDRYRVMGEAGALGEFDLVVGADGAWSRVRPLLSAVKPAYTGVLCYELEIEDLDARHPALAALLPAGKLSVAGDRRSLIAQRSSNGHVRVYAMFQVAEAQLPGFVSLSSLASLASPAKARAALIAQLPGWAPSLLAFLDAAGDRIVPRPIMALPVGHSWTSRPGLTLLGDAAHVMPPFSGEGVNMAMLDALELTHALAAADDWHAAVAGYEAKMFERAAEAAAGAMDGLDFVSENALAHVLEHFQEMQSAAGHAAHAAPRQRSAAAS